MSAETLLFYAMVFSAIALACSIVCLIHRKLRPVEVTGKLLERHAGFSILSPQLSVKAAVVAWLCFVAIAFTSDPAYTWLVSAAVMCFFAALLVDRICASAMGRHPKMFLPKFARAIPIAKFVKKDDGFSDRDTAEIEILTSGEEAQERHDEQEPEALEPAIVNVVFLLATIIAIAAFVDIFILLGMELFEVVIPHYIGQIGGLV